MSKKRVACQYCGSTESIPAKHETRHAVMCLVCKAMGPNKPTEQEAIAAWNRRVVCLDMNENPVYAGDEAMTADCKGKVDCLAGIRIESEDGHLHHVWPSEIELVKETTE